MQQQTKDTDARRQWMGVLAKSDESHVVQLWAGLSDLPAWEYLRRPEVGLVMVRGRMGGDGGPFNLGEMTVTRCSVRLQNGVVGHAWVAGRSARHAEMAAIADALMQDGDWRARVGEKLLAPLQSKLADDRGSAARKAAATRVDFFTMVRGED